MTLGERVAAAALDLVGTPFRFHGRDRATGLDCVGLVAAALQGAGIRATPPAGYRLRNREIDGFLPFARDAGLLPVLAPQRPGDILLVSPGPWQQHLVVAGRNDLFIHAHAGLGRVVAMPGPLPWPIVQRWHPTAKG